MPAHDRPNLLFIMDDQHRHDWLGCAGASFVRTPNIDKLAARGVRFTQCTTNSPVCAPARVALAAGQQPRRLGALNNNCFLPRGTGTYYQDLRDAGYRVGCVGKLDLAKPHAYNGRDGDRPAAFSWGFTHPVEAEGKMHAGNGRPPLGPYSNYLQQRGLLDVFCDDYARRSRDGWVSCCEDSPLEAEDFEDAWIGRRSVDFLDQVADDFPWHLFVSFVGPHDPYDPPTSYADHFREASMPPAVPHEAEGKSRFYAGRDRGLDDDLVLKTRRQYAAAIELIDDAVGAMLDALERRGMLDNTIIVFASDHGEMLGDHGMYTKSVPYEASVRVPLIVSGPGLPTGVTSDALVELIDVHATLLDFADVPCDPRRATRSFAPVARGEATEHRGETISELDGFRLIRTREHKFIEILGDQAELYDLQADPDERVNVITQQRDVARSLRQRLTARLREAVL